MKHAVCLTAIATLLLAAPAFAEESSPEPKDAEDSTQLSLAVRGGLTGDFVAGDPNFFGIGGLVEPMIQINNVFGAGLRLDGMALIGVNLGDDVAAGIRVLAAIVPKVEYRFYDGPVQPVVGLAGGYYTVAIVGASVSNDNEDIGAVAGGGRALGIAPQIGIQFGSFRVAALAHLVFGGQLEPVFALELSWNTFKFDF